MRSGELSGATLSKVSKHLEKAEELDAKGAGASAKAQLANAIRVLNDSGDQGELRVALKELRDSL